jgi:hypothetical protein
VASTHILELWRRFSPSFHDPLIISLRLSYSYGLALLLFYSSPPLPPIPSLSLSLSLFSSHAALRCLRLAQMPAAIMTGAERTLHHESHDDNASSHSPASTDSGAKKRSQSAANLDPNNGPVKPVKRRAAKACSACRARKVRCDVMQRYHVTADGEVTCSNCTMDGIKCVIEESKRRK